MSSLRLSVPAKTSLPTRADLERLPRRIITPDRIIAATMRRYRRDPTIVRIKRRYIGVPREAWDAIGTPTRATMCWEGWDALLFGLEDGVQVDLTSRDFARVLFATRGMSWDRLLVPGHFPYVVTCFHGFPAVRVLSCNFGLLGPDWLKSKALQPDD